MRLSSPSSSSLSSQEQSRLPQDALAERQALRKARLFFHRNLGGYLFLLPALVILASFVWYRVVLGLIISFQNVDMIYPAVWVGWANYRHVFSDPLFGIAWRNTLVFTGYALLFGYFVPIVLALLINEMRHGKGLFRLAFYLPVMLPLIVTAFLWLWLYNADSVFFNALLPPVHLPGALWLENQGTALPALVVVATWGPAGSTILLYHPPLPLLPTPLYKAT